MSKPIRIQLRRTKGWRMPPNTVKVDRTTIYGNPCVCSRPYGCPHSKDFEREDWEYEDGTIDPLRCCVDCYRHYVETGLRNEPTSTGRFWFAAQGLAGYPHRGKLIEALPKLRGKNLACWCPLYDEHGNRVPCHADVLLELANAPLPAGKHSRVTA